MLSHDSSQLCAAALDTSCIHTAKINTGLRERDSQEQQNPEIETNKALRLVKQVLLLAAGLTLHVDICVHTRVSSVCWTHFRNGRKCWQKVFIFLFEIYIHCTTAEAKLMSPWSLCAGCQNDLSCVSVCLPLYFFCVREMEDVYECILSDLWRRPRPGQKGQKRRETVGYYVPQRVFCYLLGFLDDKL